MKFQNQFKIGFLLISFLVASYSITEAASGDQSTILSKTESQRIVQPKQSKVKRFLKKHFFKKRKKRSKDERIIRYAKYAFRSGLPSLIALGFAIATNFMILPFFAALIFGIVGSLFAYKALSEIKSSENPEEHYKSKRLATIGLVFSLMTALLPILLLLSFPHF